VVGGVSERYREGGRKREEALHRPTPLGSHRHVQLPRPPWRQWTDHRSWAWELAKGWHLR
jgi:hypothetical protein